MSNEECEGNPVSSMTPEERSIAQKAISIAQTSVSLGNLPMDNLLVLLRAKMIIESVQSHGENGEGGETLSFKAVCKDDGYPENGLDESNRFAAFTPSANLVMYVNNPALSGKFKKGESFYINVSQVIPF